MPQKLGLVVFLPLFAGATLAAEQTPKRIAACPGYTVELQNPPELRSDPITHTLHTALDVGMRLNVPVPVVQIDNNGDDHPAVASGANVDDRAGPGRSEGEHAVPRLSYPHQRLPGRR